MARRAMTQREPDDRRGDADRGSITAYLLITAVAFSERPARSREAGVGATRT